MPTTQTAPAELRDAFVVALDLDPVTDVESLRFGVTDGWDSVAHMQLVAEIEDRFDVMLDAEDVIDMADWAKACEILARYGVELG